MNNIHQGDFVAFLQSQESCLSLFSVFVPDQAQWLLAVAPFLLHTYIVI